MNYSGPYQPMIAIALVAISWLQGAAQTGTQPNVPAPSPIASPFTTQVKKTVVFLEADCLHDFRPEVAQLTSDAVAKMPLPQATAIRQQLIAQITRLQNVKVSVAKLGPGEIAKLKPDVLATLDLQQLGDVLVKMGTLTTVDIRKLTPQEMTELTMDVSRGTGFIVLYNDSRLPVPAANKAEDIGFGYLVTNRHVVQPGIDNGKPCSVVNYSVLLNRKADSTNTAVHGESLILGNSVEWHFSNDGSVDLAVVPFSASPDIYDYVRIPLRLFTTQEMIDRREVVEGDPVLFSGLFIQSFAAGHTLEPIVRSGTLAMVPDGQMETTLHKLGRVYLAEAHTFSGNSGSPIFIDTNKFAGILSAPSYKLLGVISGEVLENSNFSLQVTTAFAGNLAANSDVSMVVPALEIKSILDSFQADRDAYFARQPPAK